MATAWGTGIATLDANGAVLDVRFRGLGLGDAVPGDAPSVSTAVDTDPDRAVALRPVSIVIDTDTAPADGADAYLRLHLLSHRLMLPRSMNLDGIFGHLQNVAWTDRGPVPVEASVADTVIGKLPALVGVPMIATVFAPLLPTCTPAGRPVT